MPAVTIRHFTEADIAARTELLRESRFSANLTDFATVTTDDALEASQRRTIAEEHDVKRIFTLCGSRDQVVGFAWITSIDWRSQSCELSFGLLPRYRGLYGALASAAAHEYVRGELNIRVTISQVLEHSTMMHSADDLAAKRQVRCPQDSYTVGQWRVACFWSESDQDVEAMRAASEDRRRALADRIRATAGPAP